MDEPETRHPLSNLCVFPFALWLRVLEGKLAEAKSKKDTLKARSASAKTSKQIQEMIGSLDTSSSVAAFDKMEEKVSRAGGGLNGRCLPA